MSNYIYIPNYFNDGLSLKENVCRLLKFLFERRAINLAEKRIIFQESLKGRTIDHIDISLDECSAHHYKVNSIKNK